MSHTSDPGTFAQAITPSDATVLTPTRGLYVGVSGDVAVTMLGGGDVTFSSVPVGILPVRATKVLATGTSATNIVALW